jgi:hypothetical protein
LARSDDALRATSIPFNAIHPSHHANLSSVPQARAGMDFPIKNTEIPRRPFGAAELAATRLEQAAFVE